MDSNRNALITGLVAGLVAGLLAGMFIAGTIGRRFLAFGPFGGPELVITAIMLLILTFWIAVIVAIVRALGWMGRDRSYRLEDLPAYFEEWHQRAHAHMRETAAADHPDRRG